MTSLSNTGKVFWDVRVSMRDGVELAADVVLPPGPGPFPAVLTRTPYLRGRHLRPGGWTRLVDAGYAYVVQDVRGRGDSDGEWVPYTHDARDGHDTVEWVAEQPWCTGSVGMVGASYEGRVQWFAAKEHPPGLRCIAPMAIGVADDGPRRHHDTGIPAQYWQWWTSLVSGRTLQNPEAVSWGRYWQYRPLRDLADALGIGREGWSAFVDGSGDRTDPRNLFSDDDWRTFDVPSLVILGWWDDQPTLVNWERLQASPAAKDSRLLIGAWDHGGNMRPAPTLGGLDVSGSVMDTIAHVERFLSVHLKDPQPVTAKAEPRCTVFRTGADRWEALDTWPAPQVRDRALHLRPIPSGDRCGDQSGLLDDSPVTEESAVSYVADPRNPVRLLAEPNAARVEPPLDHHYLHRRDDVLAFVGEELTEPLHVSGRPRFLGHVSTDAATVDLIVTICDVHPDGRRIVVGGFPGWPGGLRLAHRDGPDPTAVKPDEVVPVDIGLAWTHHVFGAGHRIALAIASSWSPWLTVSGATLTHWADEVDLRSAIVTVHTGTGHPSRVVLPVEWRETSS